jgi:hypothetical protein
MRHRFSSFVRLIFKPPVDFGLNMPRRSGYKLPQMKLSGNKPTGIPFTERDARVFQDLFDVLEGVYGDEAKSYMRDYLRIWKRYRELKDKGINVRVSPPRFGRPPLLIIDR